MVIQEAIKADILTWQKKLETADKATLSDAYASGLAEILYKHILTIEVVAGQNGTIAGASATGGPVSGTCSIVSPGKVM